VSVLCQFSPADEATAKLARITMARIKSGTVSSSYALADLLFAHWGKGGSRG
jgi:hypothetical protein